MHGFRKIRSMALMVVSACSIAVVAPPSVGASVPPPPNDNFAAATGIAAGSSGSLTSYSTQATKEAGEPNHAGFVGGSSVWFRFTAQASGRYTISTEGSNFDTLLGVYTGTSVGALTQVAANDNAGTDEDGSAVPWSGLEFQATAGTTYSLAVDGFGFGAGVVVLNWSVLVVNPLVVTTTSLPSAPLGSNYTGQLTASGGIGTYAWSLASGTLPAGLSLSLAGVISGTPRAVGTSVFTVRVSDSGGVTATKALTIDVVAALPGLFNKTSPKDGSKNQLRSGLVLSWGASSAANGYEVCVSRTPTCDASSTGWVSTGTARTRTLSGLAGRTTYYWQVRAVNASGTRLANSGTWWRFTTRA